MDTYRKIPVEVQAVRWTGDNLQEIRAFGARCILSVQGGWKLDIARRGPGRVEGNMLVSDGSCEEVLRLRAEGLTLREIADRMNTSLATVQRCVNRKDK
jgi:hypothetical protein